MSIEKEVEDRISTAEMNLDEARTILQVTMERFNLCKSVLDNEDRQAIGLNAEAIGTMLNIVDDYMIKAMNVLEDGNVKAS